MMMIRDLKYIKIDIIFLLKDAYTAGYLKGADDKMNELTSTPKTVKNYWSDKYAKKQLDALFNNEPMEVHEGSFIQ